MPELPEVETIRRAIEPYLLKNTVEDIVIRRKDCRYLFDKKGLNSLKGYEVSKVERRGKLLIIHLASTSSEAALFIHLGMSGQIKLIKASDFHKDYAKHDHLIIKFANNIQIRFCDPRRFGWVDVAFDADIKDYSFLTKLGVEPLSNQFSSAYLVEVLQKSQSPIKAILLNQKYIAGLGNIYVCEALYRAKIHPLSQGVVIPKEKVSRLYQAIVDILKEAILAGGSSIKDYRSAQGNLGYFQHQFAVYGKENQSCPLCQKNCIKKIVQNGRSSFYCHQLQKLYKSS
ncbi:MAG: bifunctional DNA-formamidopyrimidine glycosylase/DNA-(apurinic or apyrimidinic site) lyase [Alphaproteobacteria bacterium]